MSVNSNKLLGAKTFAKFSYEADSIKTNHLV